MVHCLYGYYTYRPCDKQYHQLAYQSGRTLFLMSRKSKAKKPQPAVPQVVENNGKATWSWIALGVIVLAVAAIRIRLLQIPLERDEGEFAYMGQLMLQGIPPYKLAYNMKYPGIYAAYALMMGIFGQTIAGVHIGLLLVSSTSIVLMFLLAKRLFNPLAGVLSAACLAVMLVDPGVLGTSAHATQYALPFVLGGCILMLKAIESGRIGSVIGSGLLFGMALLMKQHAALFVGFGVLYYLWAQFRSTQLSKGRLIGNAALMAGAAIVPFMITCALLKSAGVFGTFWFWTFTYARQYVTELPVDRGIEMFKHYIPKVVTPCFLIWIMAGVGLTSLIWSKQVRRSGVFLLGFLVIGFLTVCPGLYFRNQYFVLMLPAVALLASAGVVAIHDSFGRIFPQAKTLAVIITLIAVLNPLYRHQDFYFRMTPNEACRSMYSINPFAEAIEIGDYIKKHSTPKDLVAVLGSEPEIYFYSQRHSATGFIYTYGLMEKQKFASKMQRDMIREIETARPRYIVFSNITSSWLPDPESDQTIIMWTQDYVRRAYHLVGVTEMNDIGSTILWGQDARDYTRTSLDCVYVFERNSGQGLD